MSDDKELKKDILELLEKVTVLSSKLDNEKMREDIGDSVNPLLERLNKEDYQGRDYYDSEYYDSNC